MLINARTPEEVRVAVVDGDVLENFQVEVAERGLTRGNIYRGTIANIQPSLNAAFIEYGTDRHGFLAIQDVVPQAWYRQPEGDRPRIDEVLVKGKPIVVQVTREAEGDKGAVLTTDLSLAGRYLVLTPFDDTRGVSRKVEDDDLRKKMRQVASALEVPDDCGVIVRTNALDQNKTALQRDLAALLRLWRRIATEARQAPKGERARLLYTDQDVVIQALRDHLDATIEEILVDDDTAYEKAEAYLRAFMPRGRTRLERWQERTPLFSAYKLETQIDRIYERSVALPSGGSLVIDRTEALTAIDVNSGRSTRASSQEETALSTNLEAAVEVARQLRLRDLGGLLVVDFIDMRQGKNQRKVEKTLRDAMKPDRARSTVGRISDNGLLEINRQRVQQALSLRTHRPCPTCAGTGRIPSAEMVGLNLLRRIEARAAMAPLKRVRIALHPELADAVQNLRRREIAALESEFGIAVEIIASPRLHRAEQEVEWFSREAGEAKPAPAPALARPAARAARPAPPPGAGGDAALPAARPATAATEPGQAASTGEGKKRRRRGGRRRKGDNGEPERTEERTATERPANVEPSEPPGDPVDTAGAADASEDGAAKPRRRRGRRGGRRRGGRRSGEVSGEGDANGATGAEPALISGSSDGAADLGRSANADAPFGD
jgi:ribonuclease E